MIAALLDAIERLGSATVDDLVAELQKDVTQVRHMIHEVLDLGQVAVDHARPEAYRRVND